MLKVQCLKKSVRTEHNTAILFQNTLPASRDSWIMHFLSQAVVLYLTHLTFFCPKFISLLFQLMYAFSISPFPAPPPQTHFDFTLTTSKLKLKGLVDIEVIIAAENTSLRQRKQSLHEPSCCWADYRCPQSMNSSEHCKYKNVLYGPIRSSPVSFHLPGYFS